MDELKARYGEILTIQEEMCATLEGCDWCCGGGDEQWDDLEAEKEQILTMLQQLQARG